MAGSSPPSPWRPKGSERMLKRLLPPCRLPPGRLAPRHLAPGPRSPLALGLGAVVVTAALLTAPAMASDFADGLMGGPDVWEVRGLVPGHKLKLRASPSAQADTLAGFPEGTRLTNMGCVIRKSERWCHVAPRETGKPTGWVKGRFLREGAP